MFGVQILTPEIIFVSSRGHRFKGQEEADSDTYERLTSGMQAFASWVANVCILGCKRLRLG